LDHARLPDPVVIDRLGEVLTFTLNNTAAGNEITGPMFDAMIAALRSEATLPVARVLRIRARGDVFCTGRERAGTDAASLHREVSRLIELKRLLRASPMISIAEVQGDAFGFGFGLAILCDFTLVSGGAKLAFPEMRKGLPPAAIDHEILVLERDTRMEDNASNLGAVATPDGHFVTLLGARLHTPQPGRGRV